MEAFKPQVKVLERKLKEEEGSYGEEAEYFYEVLDNLKEFIKYKEKLLK